MAAKKKAAKKKPARKKAAKKKRVQKKTAKRPAKKVAKKMGRPSTYTQAIATKVCTQLAMGKSMRTVCEDPKLPSMRTVFNWLADKDEFLQQYTRAKAEAADVLVDEMLEIADDTTSDRYFKQLLRTLDPDMTVAELSDNAVIALLAAKNPENIQRSRLRVEARKWIASKLKPKKYGDKITHTGDEDEPIHMVTRRIKR